MKNIIKYTLVMLTVVEASQAASTIKVLNDSSTDDLYVALVKTATKDPNKGILSNNTVIKYSPGGQNTKVLGTLEDPTRLTKKNYVDITNFDPGSYDRTLWVANSAADLTDALKAGAITGGKVSFVEVGGYTKGVAIQSAGEGKFKFNLFKVLGVKTKSGEPGVEADEKKISSYSKGTEPKKPADLFTVLNETYTPLSLAFVATKPNTNKEIQPAGVIKVLGSKVAPTLLYNLNYVDIINFPAGVQNKAIWFSADPDKLKKALHDGSITEGVYSIKINKEKAIAIKPGKNDVGFGISATTQKSLGDRPGLVKVNPKEFSISETKFQKIA